MHFRYIYYLHFSGFVEDDYIPSRFKAISYAFTIYQKLKFDHDLEIKSKNLCKILSKHYCPLIQLKCVQNNMDELINCDGDWIDKSIVLSYFLANINVSSYKSKNNIKFKVSIPYRLSTYVYDVSAFKNYNCF